MTRKARVGAAFSAAAASYDGAARAQALAADDLTALVATLPPPARPRVLELGCGTGLLTRKLRPVIGGDWLVSDLSPAMVAAAQARLGTHPGDMSPTFRVIDAEHLPTPLGPFDLVVSNFAAQWFADLAATTTRLVEVLAPGGHVVLSTLGADTFREWRAAHDAVGVTCGVPTFPTAAELAARLGAGARVTERRLVLDYADGRAFAAEIKALGAATPAAGHRPLAAGDLRRVFAVLGKPVAITHHVLFVVISRD